jgi:hypothetical protein
MANKTLHSIISEIINSVYLKVKEKLEDIKGVNGRRTQYNGNKEKYKMTNNDLLHSTQKIILSITKPTE